jgi:hypothetical protein
MNLEVLPRAIEEIDSAFVFYESQVPHLGIQFLDALAESYVRILANPQAWTILPRTKSMFHRYLLRRFPYALIYSIEKNKIVIEAVMHLSRKPGYWKKRRAHRG